MSNPETTDGNLPAARRALNNAITQLIDPKPETHNGDIAWTDSLYHQLVDSIAGSKRERTGVARSQPPIWLDATQLLHTIDQQIRQWQPDPGMFDGDLTPEHPPTLPTVRRLRLINTRKWRPQDVDHITTTTTTITTWTASIQHLLTDQPHWHIPLPCPACGKQTVYRKDSAGELVRQPALRVTPQGCKCANCRHNWAPEYFVHLARVLGCEPPAGVLE